MSSGETPTHSDPAPVPPAQTQGPAFHHRRSTDPPSATPADGLGQGQYAIFARNGVVTGTVAVVVTTAAIAFMLVLNFVLNNARDQNKLDQQRLEVESKVKEQEAQIKRQREESELKRFEQERKDHMDQNLRQLNKMGEMHTDNVKAMQGVEKAVSSLAATGQQAHEVLNNVAKEVKSAATSIKEAADLMKANSDATRKAAEDKSKGLK